MAYYLNRTVLQFLNFPILPKIKLQLNEIFKY
jgi:hypothetical protein